MVQTWDAFAKARRFDVDLIGCGVMDAKTLLIFFGGVFSESVVQASFFGSIASDLDSGDTE